MDKFCCYDITKVIESSQKSARIFSLKNGHCNEYVIFSFERIAIVIELFSSRSRHDASRFTVKNIIRLPSELVKLVDFGPARTVLFLTVDGKLWATRYDHLFICSTRPQNVVPVQINGDVFDDILGGDARSKKYADEEKDYLECLSKVKTIATDYFFMCLVSKYLFFDIFSCGQMLFALVQFEHNTSLCQFTYKEGHNKLDPLLCDLADHPSNVLYNFEYDSFETDSELVFSVIESMQSFTTELPALQIFCNHEALLGHCMLLLGFPNGEVRGIPLEVIGYSASNAGTEASHNDRPIPGRSTDQVLFDLQEPISNFFAIKENDFRLVEIDYEAAREDDAVSKIKEELSSASAVIVVGQLGKVLVILQALENFNSSIFNWSKISSPVLCSRNINEFLICSTGNKICIYKFVIEVRIKSEVFAYPSLNLVLCIPSVSIVSFCGNIVPDASSAVLAEQGLRLVGIGVDDSLVELTVKLHVMEKSQNARKISGGKLNALLKEREDSHRQLRSSNLLLRSQNHVLFQLQSSSRVSRNVICTKCQCHATVNISSPCDCLLRCNITSISFDLNSSAFLSFSLQNNLKYSNFHGSTLNCVITSNNRVLPSTRCRNNTIFATFKVPFLQASINLKDVDLWASLPFTLHFSLSVILPGSETSLLDDSILAVEPVALVLPLNQRDVTVLDFYNPEKIESSRKLCNSPFNIASYANAATLRTSNILMSDTDSSQVLNISKDWITLLLKLPRRGEASLHTKPFMKKVLNGYPASSNEFSPSFFPYQQSNNADCHLDKFTVILPWACKSAVDIIPDKDVNIMTYRNTVLMNACNVSVACQTHQAIWGLIETFIIKDSAELSKPEVENVLKEVEISYQPLLGDELSGACSEQVQKLSSRMFTWRGTSFPLI